MIRTARRFTALTIAGLLIGLFSQTGTAFAFGAGLVTIGNGENRHQFKVEVAEHAKDRARGLMFRESLAEDRGMIFIYSPPRRVSMWMRNTLIPLDMLFANKLGKIFKIHRQAKPHDETPIPSMWPAYYVLEIPGGMADQLGIVAGDIMTFERSAALTGTE